MKRNATSLALVVGCFSLALGGDARAAMITVTTPIAGPTFNTSAVRHRIDGGPDIQLEDSAFLNATFAGFDEAGFGPLLSVAVSVSYVLTGSAAAQILEAAAFPASVSGFVDVTEVVRIDGSGPGTVYGTPPLSVENLLLGCTATSQTGCLESGVATVASTFAMTFDQTTPGFLANFLAPSFIVSVQLTSLLTPTVDPAVTRHAMAATLRDVESVDYALTYTFGDVPEPGTLALLALGLSGIAFARRRHSD